MTRVPRRVAVIGAGPAGAIATDALAKEMVFDTIRVFERRHITGGTWVLTRDGSERARIPSLRDLLENRSDRPTNLPASFPCETRRVLAADSQLQQYSETAAHEHLHSNLPPDIMAFTQEPIPPKVTEHTLPQYGPNPAFRHREVIREWVDNIFVKGSHHRLVAFNTSVEMAEKEGNEWVLTLRECISGKSTSYWWQERFDSVIVATGHYHSPFMPRIHAMADYDERFPGRIRHTKHYYNSNEFMGKRVIVVGGSVSAFDALHDIRLVAKVPVISSLRKPSAIFGWAPFTHPDIENRPAISAFDAETGRIVFTDNSFVNDVDVVLFATGYEFSFPFLPDIRPVNRRIPGLYQHVFKSSDPSLAFLGMVTGGFGFRIFEWQAVAAARVLAGMASLPPQEEMEKWEQNRISKTEDGPLFWALMPDFEEHFEALRAIAGEPAAGTTARVLPKYDPAWADSFWGLVKDRIEWWEKQAARAGAKSGLHDGQG